MIADPLKLPCAKMLLDLHSMGPLDAFRAMVTAGSAALSLGQAGTLEQDTLAPLKDDERKALGEAFGQLVIDMEAHPYRDLLGPVYMELGHRLDKKWGGEFFTPHELSVLLAQMNFSREMFKPGEILMANEPACGTGGMILAAAQVLAEKNINPLCMRWVAQDISALSCYGAFVNLSLWGIPARVVCGDTLAVETRWQWQTFAWNKAYPLIPADGPEAKARRMLELLRGLIEQKEPLAAPAPAKPKPAAPFGPQFGPLFGGEL